MADSKVFVSYDYDNDNDKHYRRLLSVWDASFRHSFERGDAGGRLHGHDQLVSDGVVALSALMRWRRGVLSVGPTTRRRRNYTAREARQEVCSRLIASSASFT